MDKFPKFLSNKKVFINKDLIERFKVKFPEHNDVSREKLNEIFKEYAKQFVEGIKTNREGMSFPEGLGAVFIGSAKTKTKIKSENKYDNNSARRYTNLDTDGRLMKILYIGQVSKMPFMFHKCWSFKLNKNPRIYLSNSFKEDYTKYVDITGIKVKSLFIEGTYKKSKQNEYIDKKLQKYNELDL